MDDVKILVPLIILLLAAIIYIVITMTKNKKIAERKIREQQLLEDDIQQVNNTKSTFPNVPVKEEVIEEKKEIEYTHPIPVVNIPIPTVDDTPIVIEETKPLENENLSETVQIDKTTPLEENNVEQDEIVKIEIAKELTNENESSIDIEHTEPLINDVGENVTIEEVKPVMNDVGQTAFYSIPTSNTSINTDIKVENQEYINNKTEVLSLSDIQKELNNIENKREQL